MRLLISSACTLPYMTCFLSAEIACRDGVTPDLMAFETSEHDPQPQTPTLVWSNMQICRTGRLMGEAFTMESPRFQAQCSFLSPMTDSTGVSDNAAADRWSMGCEIYTPNKTAQKDSTEDTQKLCCKSQYCTDAWKRCLNWFSGGPKTQKS